MSATRRFAWLAGGLLALGVLASAPATAVSPSRQSRDRRE